MTGCFRFFVCVCSGFQKHVATPQCYHEQQNNAIECAPKCSIPVSQAPFVRSLRTHAFAYTWREFKIPRHRRRWTFADDAPYEFREAAHELFRGHKIYVVFSASTKINVFTTLGALNGSNHLINLLFMDGSRAATIVHARTAWLCAIFTRFRAHMHLFQLGFSLAPAQYFGRFSPSKIYSIRIRWRSLLKNYLSALELAWPNAKQAIFSHFE